MNECFKGSSKQRGMSRTNGITAEVTLAVGIESSSDILTLSIGRIGTLAAYAGMRAIAQKESSAASIAVVVL